MAPDRKVRFKAGIPAVVYYRSREYVCMAHDLSRTGVLLLGGIPWPSGETVQFRLDTPSGDLHLELSGRVVRVSEDKSGHGTALALEFSTLAEDEKQNLETILHRVIEGHSPTLLSEIDPDSPAREIQTGLGAIPLPHRIGLASRAISTRERELLRNDIHPQVLEALARNPNLLESELHALLKNIHILPRTLEQIATDTRWNDKQDVLVEIIAHIRAPLPLADRLLQKLSQPALRKLIRKPGLNSTILSKLRHMVR